jgi:hypothetical protein
MIFANSLPPLQAFLRPAKLSPSSTTLLLGSLVAFLAGRPSAAAIRSQANIALHSETPDSEPDN